MIYFFKAPRSTRKSCKILNAHADRTQRRQYYPNSLGMCHTKTHAYLHTPAHTRTHKPQHPDRTLASSLVVASATAHTRERYGSVFFSNKRMRDYFSRKSTNFAFRNKIFSGDGTQVKYVATRGLF